jgi:hypothetical protein
MAFKKNAFAMRSAGFKVSPDEMDRVETVQIHLPTISLVWIGTTPVGGTTSTQAVVITNNVPDYPRNLLYMVGGSNTLGGTWTVNGKDQFGSSITEQVVIPLTSNGGTQNGTAIFGSVTSGTFSFLTGGSVGNGTPKLSMAFGTGAGNVGKFGLGVKIGAVTDVKSITWIDNATVTTFNGGTLGTAITNGNIDVVNHSFSGTKVVAATDKFIVRVRSSYVAEENYNLL